MPSAKYSLKNPVERKRFKSALATLPATQWQEKTEQYCDYRLDSNSSGGWLRAKQFTNGTLYLEASTDALLMLMTDLLQPANAVTPTANTSQQAATSPSGTSETLAASSPTKQTSLLKRPPSATSVRKDASGKSSGLIDMQGDYIGTDESGKGDYFGPLVIAGVHVTEKSIPILIELGVMDSKKLKEARIESLYQDIAHVVGEDAIATVEIGPAKYNELYERLKGGGKNLNHLLAWGHAVAIEKLLERFPECKQAIADQFGNERYILSQLKGKAKAIDLRQTPRAEANVGVAAASIVARWRFTQKIKDLSAQFGVKLPLGAAPQVKVAARKLIASQGREALAHVAKLHFKTTNEL